MFLKKNNFGDVLLNFQLKLFLIEGFNFVIFVDRKQKVNKGEKVNILDEYCVQNLLLVYEAISDKYIQRLRFGDRLLEFFICYDQEFELKV